MKRAFLVTILWWMIFVPQSESAEFSLPFYGFTEYSLGVRVVPNEYKADDVLLNEAVFRLGFAKILSVKDSDIASLNFKTDFRWDEFLDESEIDIREAHITLFPSNWWELKIGRQVFTWGTGDLVFANDLFPKDWKSFFIGRDDEYLNAPVNAVKLSLLTDFGDIDAVVVPTFTPDTYVDGERLSYWGINGLTGDDVIAERPDQTLKDAEYYFRFEKEVIYKAVEVALYSYKGFFKKPQGFDSIQGKQSFTELAVYGFSALAPLPYYGIGGTFNIESSYYDSLDDRNGTDPVIENSIIKNIVGIEKEITKDFKVGVQYYSEWMLNYDAYKKSVQTIGQPVLRKENRDWITLRLTNWRKQQRLILSFFGYYSPAENDWHLRPNVIYKIIDQFQVTVGANMFFGEHDYTFFGQLEENSNVYFRIRYSY